ncbi:molybdenum cofactor biosynthesis protein MoaE [Kocuria sp.]|uniref:molybdenum cofactor biosynthesis protein MoaE n=1 Tax=Kocuria sp. TaxID=1871328 RepID=UPI0026DF2954|nr:molybdenum cofactor biosynthesis protein MoaE [Kocuria sp.]MDO5617850.1 molybdenum cofactor biosynthesis protein MoaE [Kocuria sp.]
MSDQPFDQSMFAGAQAEGDEQASRRHAETTGTYRAVVLVASTRAAAGTYPDKSGPTAAAMIREAGHQCADPIVVADGEPLRTQMQHFLRELPAQERPDLLITSGGTGLMPDDLTPELTREFLDRQLPGVMHAIWAAGLEHIHTAGLSRGEVGVAGRTLVVNLPGSRGGVKDGMGVVLPLLDHVFQQLNGHRDVGHTTPSVEDPAPVPAAGFQPSGVQGDHPADRVEGVVVSTRVTEDRLSAASVQSAAASETTGAVVGFSGLIRNHDAGRSVTQLEYTAHPTASTALQRVCEEVAQEFPGVRLVAEHRIGRLSVGDSAMEVAAGASHRKIAFQACDALVDRIKERVPIWKQQHLQDGTHEWVNL